MFVILWYKIGEGVVVDYEECGLIAVNYSLRSKRIVVGGRHDVYRCPSMSRTAKQRPLSQFPGITVLRLYGKNIFFRIETLHMQEDKCLILNGYTAHMMRHLSI